MRRFLSKKTGYQVRRDTENWKPQKPLEIDDPQKGISLHRIADGGDQAEHDARDARPANPKSSKWKPGRRNILATMEHPDNQTSQHAEQPDPGEQIGGSDTVGGEAGHHRQSGEHQHAQLHCRPWLISKKARTGGAEKARDKATTKADHHPTRVGFQRIVGNPPPEKRRPK